MVRVFLGMPGPWAEDNCEASDHYTTKIGGLPDWPIPETGIKSDLLKCGVCGSRLCLVAQVYAPIAMDALKVEERTIYVLGCIIPKCGSNPLRDVERNCVCPLVKKLRIEGSNHMAPHPQLFSLSGGHADNPRIKSWSWRTLRVQKQQNGVQSSLMNRKAAASSEVSTATSNWWGGDLWTGEGNYEDDGDVDLEELGRALSEAGSLASHSKRQNGHAHSCAAAEVLDVKSNIRAKDASTPVISCFYIYAQEEQSSSDVSSICANYSSLTIKGSKGHVDDDCGEEETWEAESYEYDRALDADRTYLKFKKRVDVYPDQCFRYSYGGKPLLAMTDLGERSMCGICGGSRHYEMQLMPALLYFLREAVDGSSTHSLDDWNWMTVIIYTCANSCSLPLQEGANGNSWIVVEEATIIQNEKSSHDSARLAFFT